MKRWIRLVSCFYPTSWRRRYATEFDAMLDCVDTDWKDFFDILKGALTMRFTSWNFKAILLTFSLIGVAIAGAAVLSIPNMYSSTSVMHITTGPEPGNEVAPLMGKAAKDVLSSLSLEGIVRRTGSYQRQSGEETERKIRHDATIRVLSGRSKHSTAFSIRTAYTDPKVAQAINQELVTRFTAALPRAGVVSSLEVLDPSSFDGQPFYPNRYALVLTGLFGGLTIGVIVAYALRWRITILRRPAH